MNILLFGATEIGYMVSLRLYQEHSINLIDDLERLPDKFNNLDISFMSGSGAHVDALESANASKADIFFSCALLDEANIVACWTVKKNCRH